MSGCLEVGSLARFPFCLKLFVVYSNIRYYFMFCFYLLFRCLDIYIRISVQTEWFYIFLWLKWNEEYSFFLRRRSALWSIAMKSLRRYGDRLYIVIFPLSRCRQSPYLHSSCIKQEARPLIEVWNINQQSSYTYRREEDSIWHVFRACTQKRFGAGNADQTIQRRMV